MPVFIKHSVLFDNCPDELQGIVNRMTEILAKDKGCTAVTSSVGDIPIEMNQGQTAQHVLELYNASKAAKEHPKDYIRIGDRMCKR